MKKSIKIKYNFLKKRFEMICSSFCKLQDGLATVEYAVVMIAAAGFAGLLVVILKSDAVKAALESIVMDAIQIAGQ